MYRCDHPSVGCLAVRAERIGGGLDVTCGLVCNVGANLYLKVSPSVIQWVSATEAVIYQVESNTKWDIV